MLEPIDEFVGTFIDVQGLVTLLITVFNTVVIVLAIVFIPRNRRPTTALAWILTIAILPIVGLLIFFLFGTNQLSTKRRRKQAEVDAIISRAVGQIDASELQRTEPPWFHQVAELNTNLTSIPLADDNALELHSGYHRAIERIVDAIDTATGFVHVLYYTLSYDETTAPVFDALERATQRGVRVRVLYDHIGSFKYRGYRRMKRRLTEIGAEWRPTLSLWPWEGGLQRLDLRNHRKIVVVDGRVAFVGSQNLIDRGYQKRNSRLQWKDLVLRLEGPMAQGVNAVFISDWFAETDELLSQVDPAEVPGQHEHDTPPAEELPVERYATQLVPSGPGYETENNLRLFNQLIYLAQQRLVIVSPYFVPDDSLRYAITTAVQRGVSVELYVGEIGDQFFVYHAQRSYYEELLRAGVRIWLYGSPYILHSKHMTVDDAITVIGSSNMDMRSFTLNAELMLMVHGKSFVQRMREVENGYRARATELTLEEWKARPLVTRVFDNVARLTSVMQ
ncbi:cardiolipin synthase [Pseudoclavibacter endophyticus]|uniref:Cardiolipin synthase n=1 Tax=Pseudoclavibacter endophyticus TaxID=1778590 RepID=A0A6H9WPW3_9MICO|nr:cardiolipin synthase [Pseudoclavibacter endophyticus]KAB1648035.1 cardiolipin synthase [Pseudoclavibacter endophyticus]GGA69179.1 cardiolipin synthase [Pseudoclavibacter endophyticus]